MSISRIFIFPCTVYSMHASHYEHRTGKAEVARRANESVIAIRIGSNEMEDDCENKRRLPLAA
jgi:hypothetical protein